MLQRTAAGGVPSSAPEAADGNAHVADREADPPWSGALAIALILAVIVAAGVSLVTVRSRPAGHGDAAASRAVSPGGIGSAAVARAAAATWVEKQVSRSAVVSCDPAMCLALQSSGFPAAGLIPISSAAAYPLGATVIIATGAVRNQFGPRLASVYAPVVIASFGSAAARVDVRASAAGSAANYRLALGADFAERRAAGQQLLRNSRVAASPAARRALAAGHVDARLLITLAALAADYRVRIAGFADTAPGGDPLLPARSAGLAVPPGTANGTAYFRSVLSFLQARNAPLLTARTRVTGSGAAGVLQVSFPAPTPLGLLRRNQT